mgnify:CR=1 FL=1
MYKGEAKDDETGAVFGTPVAANVTYTPINDLPIITLPTLTVSEGEMVPVNFSNLGVTDEDDGPHDVMIEVSNVTNGKFVNTVDPATAITTFTLADVADGDIEFIHSGASAKPTFSVAAKDDETAAEFSTPIAAEIAYTPVNDDPVLKTPKLDVSEGGMVAVTAETIGFISDEDTSNRSLITL